MSFPKRGPRTSARRARGAPLWVACGGGGGGAGSLRQRVVGGTHRHRDGGAEEHLHAGGGDGRLVEGAQLALQGQVHMVVRHARELARGLACYGHDGHALGFDVRDHAQHLIVLALAVEHEEQVLWAADPQIPVESVCGLQEERLGGRGDQGHGHLLRDEAVLPRAREEHHALAVAYELREALHGIEVEATEVVVEELLLLPEELMQQAPRHVPQPIALNLPGFNRHCAIKTRTFQFQPVSPLLSAEE
mmetsp:Transcript_17433/g.56070  ORF Transcript_17433/g.56070 Transcript_17433/m.56070 type:complete len:248 (+) Transcript_17433:654-1397(+)